MPAPAGEKQQADDVLSSCMADAQRDCRLAVALLAVGADLGFVEVRKRQCACDRGYRG